MVLHRCSVYISAALLAAGLAAGAAAQTSSVTPVFKRTQVTHADIAAPGREAVVMKVELAAGGHAGRHTHPGDEISYIVDGEGELTVDGEPPRRIKPGEAFVIKAGVVHDLANDGQAPIHAIGVYVVDKTKPLAVPVR